jgi:hypothetical protein
MLPGRLQQREEPSHLQAWLLRPIASRKTCACHGPLRGSQKARRPTFRSLANPSFWASQVSLAAISLLPYASLARQGAKSIQKPAPVLVHGKAKTQLAATPCIDLCSAACAGFAPACLLDCLVARCGTRIIIVQLRRTGVAADAVP